MSKVICLHFYFLYARVELFNGKGGLVEGCIQSIDKTGVDFVAQEDQKVILPQGIQWQVFAAFGMESMRLLLILKTE